MNIHELVEEKNKELTDELREILGRPNFQCGRIASRMREKGFECDTKAEAEQALVIHTMITFHNEYGKHWKDELDKYLREN